MIQLEWEFLEKLGGNKADRYLSEFTENLGKSIREINGLDLWQLDECESYALFLATKLKQPSVVVETGIGSGLSSLSILSASDTVQLFSIDPLIQYGSPPRKDFGFLVSEEFRDRWKIVKGKSSEVLKKLLDSIGTIDMFIHDSDHSYENVMFELDTALDHIKSGLIFVDNFNWSEASRDFSMKHGIPIVNVCSDMCSFFI